MDTKYPKTDFGIELDWFTMYEFTSGWDRFQPLSKGPRPGLGLNER